MTIGSIGDTGAGGADCGANPCTFLDSIYAGWGSDQCVPYLACMNPNDPRVIGAVGAAATGLATDVGLAAGTGVQSLTSSMGGLVVLGVLLFAAITAIKK